MFTPGEWKVKQSTSGRYDIEMDDNFLIADVVNLANANLIVSAVNACIKINPDNPQAVAESIKDMYEALLSALGTLVVLGIKDHSWGQEIQDNIHKALSAAEGK